MDTLNKRTVKKGFGIYIGFAVGLIAVLILTVFFMNNIGKIENSFSFSLSPVAIGAHTGFVDSVTELAPMDESHDELFSQALGDSITFSLRGERIDNTAGFCSTVGELLEANGIVLFAGDVVSVPLDASLEYGMHIVIDNFSTVITSADAEIPFDTEVKYSQTVPKGKRVLVQEGIPGKGVDTIEQTLKNGEVQSSVTLETSVIIPAQSEIYEEGIGGVFVAPDGTEYNYSYYLDVSATAYGESVGTHTYTGKRVQIGMIAVDPNYIPLGSNVYVIGSYGDYGVCAAEDIGGGIKGHKIDVYLHDEDVVRKFGIRKMRAYVLE